MRVLVVQQPRYRDGLVAFAQHLLLNARRVDVVDQVFQRLQAAAEDRGVAQAFAGQAAAHAARAVQRWVVVMVVVLMMMKVVVMIMMIVRREAQLPVPGCGGGGRHSPRQILRVVAIAVRRDQDAVPRWSKVRTHGKVSLHSCCTVQRGGAYLVQPTSSSSSTAYTGCHRVQPRRRGG